LSKFLFDIVLSPLLHLTGYQASIVMTDSTVDATLDLEEVAEADHF